MKLWNTHICLTSPVTIIILLSLLLSTIVLANVWPEKIEIKEDKTKMWIPTEEDIAYQDSMYQIIRQTQNDVTDIKKDIVHILERLDYADGTWDSVRYIKGGTIDKRRNKR